MNDTLIQRNADMTPVEGICIGPFILRNLPYQRDNIFIGHISGESGNFKASVLAEKILDIWNMMYAGEL